MALFGIFTSRGEKNVLLIEIIKKLNISKEEKDIYILSLEILDEADFSVFYENIMTQIHENTYSIAPLSPQLI
jgi:hypothetical protein